jgi:hypothetical protein
MIPHSSLLSIKVQKKPPVVLRAVSKKNTAGCGLRQCGIGVTILTQAG